MSSHAYILRRLALVALVLFGVATLTFLIVRILPSEPAAVYLGPRPTADQIARVNKQLGLDKPLVVQYAVYMKNLATGQWGSSLRTKQPVTTDIFHFLPMTLQLVLLSLVFSTVVGILLGCLTAYSRGKRTDHVLRLFSTAGVALPAFFIALLLQVIFFRSLHLLPVASSGDISVSLAHPIQHVTGLPLVDALITGNTAAFWDNAKHTILPVLALAAYPTGVVMRMTRSSMLETLEQDYVRMERAMGIPNRIIILKYGLKNAMAPILTVIGLMFAYSLTGTFFIELVFSWPGLGTYATMSLLSLDYPAIMGVTVLVALAYVIVNLAVDLVLVRVDPRIVLE